MDNQQNFTWVQVANELGDEVGHTSLILKEGEGAKLPDTPFKLTKATGLRESSELLKGTNVSIGGAGNPDTVTVERGAEGTTREIHPADSWLYVVATAGAWEELKERVAIPDLDEKTVPIRADLVALVDTEDDQKTKKAEVGNLPAKVHAEEHRVSTDNKSPDDEILPVYSIVEPPLVDATEGDHFRETPDPAWTEVEGATWGPSYGTVNGSFKYIGGNHNNALWDYRKQTGIDIEASGENHHNSFAFVQLLFVPAEFDVDMDYYFGIYGEDNGSIDLDRYIRVRIQYDQTNNVWQARAESRAGSGDSETAGSWYEFGFPIPFPLELRCVVRNSTNKSCRAYLGSAGYTRSHHQIQAIDEAGTWGTVFWRIHRTRNAEGTAVPDRIYLNAVDYQSGEP